MVPGVDFEMVDEWLDFLGRAPGFADQTTHSVTKHGAGVVEAKKWVVFCLLKFTLTRDGSALT